MDITERFRECGLYSIALDRTGHVFAHCLGQGPRHHHHVSDRQALLEFLFAFALGLDEFAAFFPQLGDAIATGSSLMPQKKNPDSMELVRGKAGRVFGDLTALLTTLKGLPLAYNKDMQEAKEAVFDAFDTTSASLRVTATVLRNIGIDKKRAATAASSGYMNATELADYLVRKGMPFREAHEVVGKIVMRAIEAGKELEQMELSQFSDLIEEDVYEALSVERTLGAKNQVGGTAREVVEKALTADRTDFKTE